MARPKSSPSKRSGPKKDTRLVRNSASRRARAKPPENAGRRDPRGYRRNRRVRPSVAMAGPGANHRRLPEWCNEAALVHWVQDTDEPPSWAEAHRRLQEIGYRGSELDRQFRRGIGAFVTNSQRRTSEKWGSVAGACTSFCRNCRSPLYPRVLSQNKMANAVARDPSSAPSMPHSSFVGSRFCRPVTIAFLSSAE